MKKTIALLIVVAGIVCGSCNRIEEYESDNLGNFDALWTFVDQHYCFLEEKGLDWNAVGDKYRPMAKNAANSRILFEVLAQMLDELRDGHVNLSSSFNTSYYRRWWSDYPQNYDERLVQQYYLNFDYNMLGSIYFGFLQPYNIGYLRIPDFTMTLGEGNIDNILAYFNTCSGLIIDIRDNGGGQLTEVGQFVSRFIDHPITAGYMMHKTGPGHNDFSKPYEYTYSPASQGHLLWLKPIAVLTNRSTFSAANNFAGIMKSLPQVTLVGATTGGGSGMPLSSELPNGWGVRISACRILDPEGQDTEFGVEPTEGWAVDLDAQAALNGQDTMLEAAIRAVLTPSK